MGFFEIIAMLSLCLAGASTFIAIKAIKVNLYQAKQLQQLYQALSTLQIYFYEGDDEWEEYVEEVQRPAASHHKVIDLFTGLPILDEED